jgi:hypothetical protein
MNKKSPIEFLEQELGAKLKERQMLFRGVSWRARQLHLTLIMGGKEEISRTSKIL